MKQPYQHHTCELFVKHSGSLPYSSGSTPSLTAHVCLILFKHIHKSIFEKNNLRQNKKQHNKPIAKYKTLKKTKHYNNYFLFNNLTFKFPKSPPTFAAR